MLTGIKRRLSAPRKYPHGPQGSRRKPWVKESREGRGEEGGRLYCNMISAMLVLDCLIRFVGLETNEQQKLMPRMSCWWLLETMWWWSALACWVVSWSLHVFLWRKVRPETNQLICNHLSLYASALSNWEIIILMLETININFTLRLYILDTHAVCQLNRARPTPCRLFTMDHFHSRHLVLSKQEKQV